MRRVGPTRLGWSAPPALGAGGPEFKSRRPDQSFLRLAGIFKKPFPSLGKLGDLLQHPKLASASCIFTARYFSSFSTASTLPVLGDFHIQSPSVLGFFAGWSDPSRTLRPSPIHGILPSANFGIHEPPKGIQCEDAPLPTAQAITEPAVEQDMMSPTHSAPLQFLKRSLPLALYMKRSCRKTSTPGADGASSCGGVPATKPIDSVLLPPHNRRSL